MPDDCIFCAIIRGEAEASFVHQDDAVVAFMDIQPITQGHLLVVPREHAVSMADVSDQAAMRAFRIARKLSEAVRRILGAAGVNLLVADGEVAFQEVPHFHIHVIPRYPGDGFSLQLPASMATPPSRAQLDAIATALHAEARVTQTIPAIDPSMLR